MRIRGAVLGGVALAVLVGPLAVPAAEARPLKPAFNANLGTGFSGGYIRALEETSDGKVIVAGNFDLQTLNGVPVPNDIVRLNADGTPDAAWIANWSKSSPGLVQVSDVKVQRDGSVLVAACSLLRTCLLKIGADGSFDAGWSLQAEGFTQAITSIALQRDGKIVLGGVYGGDTVPQLARLNSDGSLDQTFANNVGLGFDGGVQAVAVQRNGKILVGGAFAHFRDSAVPFGLVRLNADGTLDTGFREGSTTGFNGTVYSIAVQPDRKILVGGGFSTLAGSPVPGNLVRLRADGSLDTDFNSKLGSGFSDPVGEVLLQSDGKVLVRGQFGSFDGAPAPARVMRLLGDGSPDASFNAKLGTGFNNPVYALAQQSNGGILVGGYFTSVNGTTVPTDLVRLQNSGARSR